MAEEDLYLVLGLPGGIDGLQVTAAELRKAYRKRAIECHPDKRPDDAAAAEEFLRVQRAYEILSDENARKAYDEVLQLRKQRMEKQVARDAKRQKMYEDLVQAEAAFEQRKNQKVAEDNAAKRLKEELERIRAKKKASVRATATFLAQQQQRQVVSEAVPEFWSLLDDAERQKTLKVTWDRSATYTEQTLRQIFEKFGVVKDVVVLKKKSKKNGSALVIMGTAEAADSATSEQCGDLSNPLLVKPFLLTSLASSKEPPISISTPPPAQTKMLDEDSILDKLVKAQKNKKAEGQKRARQDG